MIKTVNGATTMSGDVPTIMADFLSVSDSFIRYITDKFEVNEARAIIGYDVMRQFKEVLTDIMETEGDE